MTLFDVIAVLLTLSALFSYINHCYIRLPASIGVMLLALLLSLGLVLAGHFGLPLDTHAARLLSSIDFNQALLHGMLSFLLFAGALHVNLNDLASQKWVITLLATIGLLVSTFLVGTLAWVLFDALGLTLPLLYCLLFGALISPTDPIAVLGILKKAGVSKSLETKITGESLFNDGVAVVVFLVLLGIVQGGDEIGPTDVLRLFFQEAVGGALLGLVLGWLVYHLFARVDQYQVEVLLTLSLVTGGYALASALHLSGPIAIVVAGLLIGNQGRRFAMSATTVQHLDTFWELVDEVLNAVLFLLIGLELLVLTFTGDYLIAGLVMIPLVLAARLISVALPVMLLRRVRAFSPGVIRLLTWGGLRGGISVALALSLPAGEPRQQILAVTYVVVVFSIVVQGLTIGRLVKRSS
ncbi:MAG: sodium:proton antiporter [Proteobacteria bacterium]|nr:MAG: sodium:proton antiporter [Pseudomonadota bacterium]QKK11276.1 MAG: sodium:proton antiporter [Pseudomonadota bacterium]